MSHFVVAPAMHGERLDRLLAQCIPDVARAQLHRWIVEGHVQVDGAMRKPAYRVRAAQTIAVAPPEPTPLDLQPEALPLDILFEDPQIVVVNKPAGMVVHPGAGQSTGTLVNALLAHCQDLPGIGDRVRPGIVHRLDKGTSGVMIVAKTQQAHQSLVQQFQQRTVEKWYLAMVWGRLAGAGWITQPIGRHPTRRQRMSTVTRRGRSAQTEWRVREAFGRIVSWVEVRLHTGRTHQIRVHFAAQGHALVGDATYGSQRGWQQLPAVWQEVVRRFDRPALHAWRLGVAHPVTGARLRFEAPLPVDLQVLLQTCRELARDQEVTVE